MNIFLNIYLLGYGCIKAQIKISPLYSSKIGGVKVKIIFSSIASHEPYKNLANHPKPLFGKFDKVNI